MYFSKITLMCSSATRTRGDSGEKDEGKNKGTAVGEEEETERRRKIGKFKHSFLISALHDR